jgi:hypothetical protein
VGLFWHVQKAKSSQKHDESSQSGLRQRRFRAEWGKPPPKLSQVHLKRTIVQVRTSFTQNEHYFLKFAQVPHKVPFECPAPLLFWHFQKAKPSRKQAKSSQNGLRQRRFALASAYRGPQTLVGVSPFLSFAQNTSIGPKFTQV